jgi:lipoprotein NlpI
MTTWPAPIVSFFLGQITEAALIASATNSDAKKVHQQLCEANFYIGQLALRRDSNGDAKRSFQAALADCPRQMLETAAATAELAAIESHH